MRRIPQDDSEAIGGDSFLDVIANLVGILIILVVVVGAQAGHHLSQRPTEQQQALTQALEQARRDSSDRKQRAASLERDQLELQARLQQEEALAGLAETERDALQRAVLLAERELDERRSKIESERLARLDQNSRVQELQARLASLTSEADRLRQTPVKTATLTHHATPLARTVFNDEVHFRLSGGLLAPVPLDELLQAMTADFPNHADTLRAGKDVVATVGPLEGFQLQYRLQVREQVARTEFGVARRAVPEFTGFILIPTRLSLGEPSDRAIQAADSELRRRLARRDAAKTTVTIWVYPDSYNQFIELERWLHEQGFLVASWPLPDGQPIAGGPNGMRSVAQ